MNFFDRVEVNDETGCHIWKGPKDKDGYGLFWNHKKLVRAHRLAFERAYGIYPGKLFVLHRCDVPSCVNPDHLFLGTAMDNAQDRNKKKRQAKGESFPLRTKRRSVTEEIVREIRGSNERECEIVRRLKLPQSTVNHIRLRRSWKHVV